MFAAVVILILPTVATTVTATTASESGWGSDGTSWQTTDDNPGIGLGRCSCLWFAGLYQQSGVDYDLDLIGLRLWKLYRHPLVGHCIATLDGTVVYRFKLGGIHTEFVDYTLDIYPWQSGNKMFGFKSSPVAPGGLCSSITVDVIYREDGRFIKNIRRTFYPDDGDDDDYLMPSSSIMRDMTTSSSIMRDMMIIAMPPIPGY